MHAELGIYSVEHEFFHQLGNVLTPAQNYKSLLIKTEIEDQKARYMNMIRTQQKEFYSRLDIFNNSRISPTGKMNKAARLFEEFRYADWSDNGYVDIIGDRLKSIKRS